MKRLLVVSLVVAAAFVLSAGPAVASSVHLKGGRNAEPSFTDNGLTLTASGALAGLGGGDVKVTLSAQANPTATCTNPAGATQPPGQNPASVNVTGTTLVKASDIKNGNVTISTTTEAPTSPIPGAPDCPNPMWTETITDMAFLTATITVFQDSNGNGIFESNELVLTVKVTFSPPTSNGTVPESGFTFTSS